MTAPRVLGRLEAMTFTDNEAESRYEAHLDGVLAGVLDYALHDGWIVLVHTEVPPAFEGHGIGSGLAKAALDDARARSLSVTPQCPFVLRYIQRHREYRDLIVGMRGPHADPMTPPQSGGVEWLAGTTLPPGDLDSIERALGWRPTLVRRAAVDRGASETGARWIVGNGREQEPARTAFVKVGATAVTAEWFRTEHANYLALDGWFLPRVLGFADGERPVLALEDLSNAAWPPPWTDARIEAVIEALTVIHKTPPPAHLTPLELDGAANWRSVAADPGPFLALGLCTAEWLDAALPALEGAAAAAPLGGTALVHLDIRSDNLCFRDGRAVVIDWNHATIANPDLDTAFWLPSLHTEGGPRPETLLPDAPGLAAWVAGFFCAHAGGRPFPEAPHVRPLQLAQARTALPWAARALGLPPPDA